MHQNRPRIYEIPLHTTESRRLIGDNPTVTVHADRSVTVYPPAWASVWPTRREAVRVLLNARRMGYAITRRYL